MKLLGRVSLAVLLLSAAAPAAQTPQTSGTQEKTAKRSRKGAAETASAGPVDINTASERQLEELPGVGPATAKKIIAGRPYGSVDDLKRAGISQKTIDEIRSSVKAGAGQGAPAAAAPQGSRRQERSQKASSPLQIDINTASPKELEQLPGVGRATADKIFAGRPYSSVDDLKRAGVSQRTIDQIRPSVTAGAAPGASASAGAGSGAKQERGQKGLPLPSARVDLNTASPKELEQLPGVGPATANKIVAGRPYGSVDDLKRAGVPQRTIDQIRPNVMAGLSTSESAHGGAKPGTSGAGEASNARQNTQAQPRTDEGNITPAQPGMVWVNTDSGIFHREGSRWYGKTKHGKYMSEADALKAGYREAKRE